MSTPGAVFPAGLLLDGRRCAVVGPLASATPRLAALEAAGAVVIHLGASAPDVAALRGAFLCLVTEDVPEDVARATAAAARAAGALVWCGDRPGLSDLSLPAVLRRGRVLVTVSTGGASPALAVRLRDELATLLGEELGAFAEALAAARAASRQAHPDDPAARRADVQALVDGVRVRGTLELPPAPAPAPSPAPAHVKRR